jgi:hypothetical protein
MAGDVGQLHGARHRRSIQEIVISLFALSSIIVLLNLILKVINVSTPVTALVNLICISSTLSLWIILGEKSDKLLLSVTLRTYGKLIHQGLLTQDWAKEDS